ncbi:Carcinine transporter [Nymphon striatum]|nr:Carcinine transporter [Nymphon striatum]
MTEIKTSINIEKNSPVVIEDISATDQEQTLKTCEQILRNTDTSVRVKDQSEKYLEKQTNKDNLFNEGIVVMNQGTNLQNVLDEEIYLKRKQSEENLEDNDGNEIEKAGQPVCHVTFDQSLYMKASEIIAASPELKTCLVTRLGGFQLIMSYMGAIGYIMDGSGLDVLWQTVCADDLRWNAHINKIVKKANSTLGFVKRNLYSCSEQTKHAAYVTIVRPHLEYASAVWDPYIQDQINSIEAVQRRAVSNKRKRNHVDTNQLRQKLSSLIDKDCDIHNIQVDLLIKNFVDVIERASVDVAAFRTGKLWINYIRQITILKLFIHAERSGDWYLHLYPISQMIPYLHAAGRTQYAKSARLYHQTMKTVQSVMSEDDYARFTTHGYFTIRRTHHFWSGIFTDQTIEQNLMRMLKSAGGMTHGREITESTLTNWVHSFPFTIPICKSIEQFTNINCTSSYQHRDLNAGSESKDKRDHETFYMWLSAHSPFVYTCESVVCLSTGMVAGKIVNCDNAFEVGCIAASDMTNGNFSDVKLKRNDKVKNIAKMEVYLSYELAPQPPSLFLDGLMRKSPKSELGQLFRSKAPLESCFPDDAMYIVDGGYLLRVVIWPANPTYSQVCDSYVSYTERHYGNEAIVVFDGYECTTSTKSAEQKRRATKSSSRDIMFDESMQTVTTQSAFSSNDRNKTRLISMLVQQFKDKFIKTRQATADADRLIVETALSESGNSHPVVVIGTDTDLLVMLISLAPPDCGMYMLCSTNPIALYSITLIQNAVGNKKPHLLFAHSVTGCDTVSALFGLGKKKAIDILDQYTDDDSLDVFINETSSKVKITSVGEKFILKLYGAPKSVDKLDKQRYLSYNKSIRRSSLTTAFKLESLPPTSRAAYFHLLRTYLQVQQWIGNTPDATKWGWYLQDDTLKPVETDQPAAPDTLLKMVACSCDKILNYDDLVEQKIGQFGKAQAIFIFLICLPAAIPAPMAYFAQIFLTATPDHWCYVPELADVNLTIEQIRKLTIPHQDSTHSQCKMYDVNFTSYLNQSEGNLTADPTWKTTSCKNGWIMSNFGVVIGGILYAWISDKYGRRMGILVPVLVLISSGIISAFCPEIFSWMILRTIQISCLSLFLTNYVYSIEIVGKKYRSTAAILMAFAFCSCVMIVSGLAYLTKEWKYLTLAICVPSVVALPLICRLVVEMRKLVFKKQIKIYEYLLLNTGSNINEE